ncbi:MAG: RNA methyltransferase [Gemmatimonadetes bacterium]|nr:RNA methyltransferase [Gemmatimonadota bacterium]
MPESSVLSKRKETYLRGLASRAVRESRGHFLAEGVRVIEEALAGAMRVTDIVGTPSASGDIERWTSEGRLRHVHVSVADERVFRTLSTVGQEQGVLAVVEASPALLPDRPPRGPVLLLDRVQDPGNAGTLLRTLRATGGDLAIALAGTVDLFNPKVVRSSAGSLFHVRLATGVSLDAAVAWMVERALPLVALDPAGESLFESGWIPRGPFALAVGNEGAGLDARLLEAAAERLALPMAGGVESLNAGVSGSVALYELTRRGRAV